MTNPVGRVATRRTAEQTLRITLSCVFLSTSAFGAIDRFYEWPGQTLVEVIWIILGLTLTVVWMKRNLPLQNVLLAMATLAGLCLIAILAVEAGRVGSQVNFGLASTLSPSLAKFAQAAAWTLLLLNAQGMARPLAARKESNPNYGLWMLGLASALVCGFQAGIEATLGVPSNTTWSSEVAMILGWYGFAFVCLALASPAQLKRKPGAKLVSIEPAWVWIGLNLFAIATAANRGLWKVAVFHGALAALGVWSAWRAFGNR